MSEENEKSEKMSEAQKILYAVIGVFVVGFLLVWSSKQEDTSEGSAQKAQLIMYSAMQQAANQKCPRLIKDKTGDELFFATSIDSDKDTYVTLNWVGEPSNHFKKASCTMRLLDSGLGISKLVIDDEVLIDREKK